MASARRASRAGWLAAVAASAALVGCGGADQTDGAMAKPDAEAAKRQDDMRQFYAKNPLPKPKRHP